MGFNSLLLVPTLFFPLLLALAYKKNDNADKGGYSLKDYIFMGIIILGTVSVLFQILEMYFKKPSIFF